MCFSPYLDVECRGGGGAPKGLVNNLLLQLFTMGSSNIEVSENYFLIFRPPKMTIQGM